MHLYFMRHGRAENGGPHRPDFDRRLTPAGFEDVRAQARRFAGAPVRPEQIVTSPYVRARTTAEAVAEHLGVPLDVADALGCGATLDDYAEALFPHHPLGAVLVVGHQPDLGQAILLLTGRRAEMRPGTVARVEIEAVRPRGGTLGSVWQPGAAGQAGAG